MYSKKNSSNYNPAPRPTNKLEKNAERVKLYFNIANLALTIIVGIVVAIYIQFRQEELAKELQERDEANQARIIEMQAQINKNIDLAKIEIDNRCSSYPVCPYGTVTIKNTGPSTAENVRVVISIEYIGDAWRDTVQSFDDLSVSVVPRSIDYNVEKRKESAGSEYLNQEYSAALLQIKRIPPQSEIQVVISKINDMETMPAEIELELAVGLDADEVEQVDYLFNTEITKNITSELIQTFSIIDLFVEASCDNCVDSGSQSKMVYLSTYFGGSISLKDIQQSEGMNIAIIEVNAKYSYPAKYTGIHPLRIYTYRVINRKD